MSESTIQPRGDPVLGGFFVLILAAVKNPSCTCDSCEQLRQMADDLIAKSKER